jgi:arginine exporter protein ArgO
MSEQLVSSVTTVLLAIVGVAIIAVLVSKNANTTNVISAGGSAFSQGLGTALSPVTGGGYGSLTGLSASLG